MIERSASLPTRFMSSPCPAMPTTSVEKISGTISDLIMRRKIVDSTLSDDGLEHRRGLSRHGVRKRHADDDAEHHRDEDPVRQREAAEDRRPSLGAVRRYSLETGPLPLRSVEFR